MSEMKKAWLIARKAVGVMLKTWVVALASAAISGIVWMLFAIVTLKIFIHFGYLAPVCIIK